MVWVVPAPTSIEPPTAAGKPQVRPKRPPGESGRAASLSPSQGSKHEFKLGDIPVPELGLALHSGSPALVRAASSPLAQTEGRGFNDTQGTEPAAECPPPPDLTPNSSLSAVPNTSTLSPAPPQRNKSIGHASTPGGQSTRTPSGSARSVSRGCATEYKSERPQWNSSTRVRKAPPPPTLSSSNEELSKKKVVPEERNLLHWRVPHEPNKKVSWEDDDEMDFDVPPEKFDPATGTWAGSPSPVRVRSRSCSSRSCSPPEIVEETGTETEQPPEAPLRMDLDSPRRESDPPQQNGGPRSSPCPQEDQRPTPPTSPPRVTAPTSPPRAVQPQSVRLKSLLRQALPGCVELARTDRAFSDEVREMLEGALKELASAWPAPDTGRKHDGVRKQVTSSTSPKRPPPVAVPAAALRSSSGGAPRPLSTGVVVRGVGSRVGAERKAGGGGSAQQTTAGPAGAAVSTATVSGVKEGAGQDTGEKAVVSAKQPTVRVHEPCDDDDWEIASVSSHNEAVLASIADAGVAREMPRVYGRGKWIPPPPRRLADRRSSTSGAANTPGGWAEVPVRKPVPRGRLATVAHAAPLTQIGEGPRPARKHHQRPTEDPKKVSNSSITQELPRTPPGDRGAGVESPDPDATTPLGGSFDSPSRSPSHQDRRRRLSSKIQSPEKMDAEDARQRLEDKLRRAGMNRELIAKEKQFKLNVDDDKRALVRTKLEAAAEQKRLETNKRLEAAGERAQEETKKREEKARTENERVEETMFFQRAAREDKANELRIREQKLEKTKEIRESREREKRETEAARREESSQAVMARKREIEEEREKKMGERLKRTEECFERADEVRRQEALKRQTTAEAHARRLAEQRERETKRDEEMKQLQEERMESSAANRAKSLERKKARLEQTEKRAQEAADRRKEGGVGPTKSARAIFLEKARESRDRACAKKRRQRMQLVMEKNARDFLDGKNKKDAAADAKSRLSRPVSKLRSILQSGFSAKARAVVAELATMVGVAPGVKSAGDRSTPGVSQQDHQYLRASNGMDVLARLIQEDTRVMEAAGKPEERQSLITRPAGTVLLHLLENDVLNIEHFVRAGGLLPVLDGVCVVAETQEDEALAVLLGLVDLCLRYVLDEKCPADVRNCCLSYTDAIAIGEVCYALLHDTPPLPLPSGDAGVLHGALAVYTHWLGLQHGASVDEACVAAVEVLFGLATNLLLPGGSSAPRQGVCCSPTRGLDLSAGGRQGRDAPRPEVTCLCFLCFRALNAVSRVRLDVVQRRLREMHGVEFYHVASVLLIACYEHHAILEEIPPDGTFEGKPGATPPAVPPVHAISKTPCLRAALHELLLFMGYAVLGSPANRALFRWGQTPVLQLLTNLPLAYFNAYKHLLYPTLVLACLGDEENVAILTGEIDATQLVTFLQAEEDMLAGCPPSTPRHPTLTPRGEALTPVRRRSSTNTEDQATAGEKEREEEYGEGEEEGKGSETPKKTKSTSQKEDGSGTPVAADASPQRTKPADELTPAEQALRAMLGKSGGRRQKQGTAYASYFRVDRRLSAEMRKQARVQLSQLS
eukprot:Hpha_TRINITY_DN16383_c0_g1::TRINITY_DN16383_c0_g1_i5::g.58511::m.58511